MIPPYSGLWASGNDVKGQQSIHWKERYKLRESMQDFCQREEKVTRYL